MKTITREETKIITTAIEASDGTRFYITDNIDENTARKECEKYESSATMIVKKRIERIRIAKTTHNGIDEWGSYDEEVEILLPKNEDDIKNIIMYLQMTSCIGAIDGVNTELIKPDKEIIIWWGYDRDYFSLDTYETWIGRLNRNYNKAIEEYKENKEKNNG